MFIAAKIKDNDIFLRLSAPLTTLSCYGPLRTIPRPFTVLTPASTFYEQRSVGNYVNDEITAMIVFSAASVLLDWFKGHLSGEISDQKLFDKTDS